MCLGKSFRYLTPNMSRTLYCGLLSVTMWDQWCCVGVFSPYGLCLLKLCLRTAPLARELRQKWCATGSDLTVAALGDLSHSLRTCSVEARPAACSTAGFGFQTVTQPFFGLMTLCMQMPLLSFCGRGPVYHSCFGFQLMIICNYIQTKYL